MSAPNSPTAGTAQSVTVTAQDAYQNKATAYTGNKTLTWTGPGSAPDGTDTPTYPANPVPFTSGTATATITLVKAESPTLKAGDGTISGTSGTFAVSTGAPARLAWTGLAVTKGSLGSPCFFACTVTNLSSGQLSASVSMTDAGGNTVNNLGAGNVVSLAVPDGGTVTPASVSIAASGPAVSGTFVFKPQTGNWTTDRLTAALAPYASATATISK